MSNSPHYQRACTWLAVLIATVSVALACSTMLVSPETSAASNVPNPPTNVTAIASTTTNTVTVSWAFSPLGLTPDRARVIAYDGTISVGRATCTLPVCTTMQVPGLTVGTIYTFVVKAGVQNGYSVGTTSAPVQVVSTCLVAGACVTVNANDPEGLADHVAAGLLHGIDSTVPTSLVRPLDIQNWRTATGPAACSSGTCIGAVQFNTIRQADPSATVTAILSANWYQSSFEPYRECGSYAICLSGNWPKPWGGAQTPWANWTAYDSFISNVVTKVEANGQTVNYWDLLNEPPSQTANLVGLLDAQDSTNLTNTELEQWLLHTYDAVRAADPNAKVVCPSFESFQSFPGEAAPGGQLLDFSTFLAFAQANGMDCNAFSWHEINYNPTATDFNDQPENVTAHVQMFRNLLASYPTFRQAQIFINEYLPSSVPTYGTQSYESMPGWAVGYISALEAAGVSGANLSCGGQGCSNLLDGLLVSTGPSVAPSATYWPYWFYAQMTGNVVPVTTSAEQISGFATLDPASGTVRVLLGRHETEVGGNTSPESVSMAVNGPWGNGPVTVDLQDLANVSGAVSEPSITTVIAEAVNGVVTVLIPSIGAYDAYAITMIPMTPAAALAAPPAANTPPSAS